MLSIGYQVGIHSKDFRFLQSEISLPYFKMKLKYFFKISLYVYKSHILLAIKV